MMLSVVLLFALPALGSSLSTKPQMGWNSWNTFKNNINQTVIEDAARVLVEKDLAKVGYNYVLIDDGWQEATRDADNRQQANATRFPSGIATLADHVHSLGLKLGIYSDAGIYDCAFYPGSYGYEELDAATYASWGIDYLKYDNCGGFHANTQPVQERFLRMAHALKDSGRDIFYSMCEWGHQFPWFWADQFSDSYRISGDIKGSFAADSKDVCQTAYCLNTGYAGVSILTMIRKMRELSKFQKPGSWGVLMQFSGGAWDDICGILANHGPDNIADMDMLEIGTRTMNVFQEQTHMAFWAALKSPLIIGADMTKLNQSSLDILSNKEIIAISQDDAGVAVDYLPDLSIEDKIQVWAGPLSSGTSRHVILALNYGSEPANITIPRSGIPGLKCGKSGEYVVRNVWEEKDLGKLGSRIELGEVGVHETKVLVLKTS